jgi:hypothetical protein
MADHHRDDGISAAAAPIHGIGGGKNVRGCDARRSDAFQFGGEHVQQNLGV